MEDTTEQSCLTSAVSPDRRSEGMMSESPSFIPCSSSFTLPTIMNIEYSLQKEEDQRKKEVDHKIWSTVVVGPSSFRFTG